MKKIISENAPAPIGPYSQAIEINGFIYTSGQIALDAKSGQIVSDDLDQQVHQVIQNLEAVLKAADSDLNNVIKTTIFLASMDDFVKVNEIYGSYFNESKPARSTVEVSCLPKNVLVEIDCIAIKKNA